MKASGLRGDCNAGIGWFGIVGKAEEHHVRSYFVKA
jgi:hypothetical protein